MPEGAEEAWGHEGERADGNPRAPLDDYEYWETYLLNTPETD